MSGGETLLGPFLVNQYGERYLPRINGEIFSKDGSDTIFRRQFGDSLAKEDHLYLIVGTDSGLFVQYILDKGLPLGTRFLFIEFPEIIERLQEWLDFESFPKNLAIVAPDKWEEQAAEFSLKDYFYLQHIERLKSMAVVDAHYDAYLTLHNDVQARMTQYNMAVNMEVGSKVFMMKGLENLSENRTPSTALKDLFKGQTAVLMAGGPSLDECFPWVKANRDKLVVLAVSRIAPQLLREGVVPDLIFSIDPHTMIFHQSKDMLAFHEETLFVNMYHAHPALVGQWRGRSVYMGSLFPWETELNPDNYVFSGITVSHQALGVAVRMGFTQLVLGGFDLCFSREGFTHLKGSVERDIGPFTESTELRVETNGGWQAETRYDFYSAIPSMGVMAEEAVVAGCRVINPAQGAAKIPHVEHLPWEEVALEKLPQPPREVLREKLPEDHRESRQAHYEMVVGELQRVREEVEKIKELTEEGLDCNARLFGRKGELPDFKYKTRMDEIEEILDNEYGDISALVRKWSVREFLKLSRPDRDREWSDEEIEETGRRYYENYSKSADELINLMGETIERVETRMEEEQRDPDYERLARQWQKDEQPGRIHLFFDRQGCEVAQLPSPWDERFREIMAAHEEQMAATENTYSEFCLQDQAQPGAVKSKALTLYRQKNIQKLKDYQEGLAESGIEGKEHYGHLIQGYIAELEGNLDRAVRCFRQITLDSLMQEAMQRIFSLSLRQKDMLAAMAVAKRLSSRSPLFIPYYADLLRLSGDREGALAVYSDYVKIVKKDFVTLLKIGRLKMEMKDISGAMAVFKEILEEDPDNKAARLFVEQLAKFV
ncbi:MAG: DUF115 domain-containing protein [Magnetococcales bacterium]|nr:DUF115 domain-containing protein [Magnetococcales bacterium]